MPRYAKNWGHSAMASEWRLRTVEEIKGPEPNALATGPFGSAISSKHFSSHGCPVIRGSNLSQNISLRLIDDGLVFVSEAKAKDFRRSIARRGDLIFTCWGTIDQVGFIDERSQYSEYVISNKQMKFTPDASQASGLFLYYLFSSPVMRSKILSLGIGSSVPGFNLGQFRKLPLSLPPLREQQEIARILGLLDDRIELTQRTNASLEAIAQAIFQSWFVGFDPVRAKAEGREPEGMDAATAALFPCDLVESELGPIPEYWRCGSLADLMEMQGGTQPPASTFVDEPREGYVRLLQIRDYATDAHATYIPYTKNLRIVTAEDVLIGRYGSGSGDAKKDSMGRYLRGLDGAINVAIVKAIPKKMIYRNGSLLSWSLACSIEP